MSNYNRTISAALAETQSKFKLAEALALDIPPRRGRTAEDETSTLQYLTEAREAIISAGGETRSVHTLTDYRQTALWVMDVTSQSFLWVKGASFSAHREARAAGIPYDEFAKEPKTVRQIRDVAEKISPDGPPEKIVQSWTSKQKASAARELLREPVIADQVIEDKQARTHVEAAAARHYRRDDPPARKVQPRSGPSRDYDAKVVDAVSTICVALVARDNGVWTPDARSEALLYFLRRMLIDQDMPEGNWDELFSEIENYANSEVPS